MKQHSCGVDIPVEVDGGIAIRNVQKKYNKQLEAEFIHRGIGHREPYKKLSMKEKANLLRISETKNLVAEGKAQATEERDG